MTTLSPEAPAVTSPSDPAPEPASTDPAPAAPAKPFEGLTVIVTGDVDGFTRDSANAAIAFLGGKPVASVSGKTGLVIMGEGAGVSKMGKARDHNLNVITGEAFSALAHAFRDGTWDGKPVGEPVRDYDRRMDPTPVADEPFRLSDHLVGKAAHYAPNSAGRIVREIRQWCSCGHWWLSRDLHGETCPVEAGVCEPNEEAPWDSPGYEPVWPPRDMDAAPAEYYEVMAVLEAERIAALPQSTIGTSNVAAEDQVAAEPSAPTVAPTSTQSAAVTPTPVATAPAPPVQADPVPAPESTPAPTPEPVVEPAGFIDESWSTERDEPRGRRRTPPPPMDDFWPTPDDAWGDLDHGSFEPEDDGFDTSTWDTAPGTTPPAQASAEPAPEPVSPPEPAEPVRGARRLTTDDVDALLALRGNTEPSQEERILEVALLNSPANRVHAITETTPAYGPVPETERLLAIAVLMTDGLTKAVLTDIAVAPGADRYLADDAIAAAVDMLPDYIQAIVFCRETKTDTYAQHGFETAPGFAVMFR